jgi:hypothetical protein
MRGRSVAMIVAARHRMQEIFAVSLLIVAERQSGRFLVCRACGRSAWAARSFQCAPPSIALDVHLENRGVVNKAIDCRKRHGLIGENFPPFTEGLICSDEQRPSFVARADKFEQHARFCLVFARIRKIIENQQMVLVKLGDGAFEHKIPSCGLESLDEIGGSGKQHSPAVLDECETKRRRQMTLAAARRTGEILPTTTARSLSSAIRIIRGAGIVSQWSAPTRMVACCISWCFSRMTRWRFCPRG